MVSRDDVSRTLPNWEEYLQHITRYADGSARSKVANAVRDGRNAHEYDDEKDDVKE
jgi:glutathione S-transferase